MNTVKDIVVSLELAVQLKNMGITQNSALVWMYSPKDMGYQQVVSRFNMDPLDFSLAYVSAFTSEELAQKMIKVELTTVVLENRKVTVTLWDHVESSKPVSFTENTEADARAKAYMYLLENKLIPII